MTRVYTITEIDELRDSVVQASYAVTAAYRTADDRKLERAMNRLAVAQRAFGRATGTYREPSTDGEW